ncbi:MAG: 4-alpha-glucanotransferase [Chloroflexi bacterium]|nr:4-alpha-glucanotransferase [Chloroflexota bacterium]
MKFQRSNGILLHPSSLPGPYGIGDLGPEAFRFVDFLADSGVGLWQVLPLGPTGYGDSPYQCFSAFAGNPYLISPDFLLRDDYLHPNDLIEKTNFPARKVDFGRLIPWKLNLLERAYLRFNSDPSTSLRTSPARDRSAFDIFCADASSWLDDFALFMAIKESHGGGGWGGWPAPLRTREPSALAQARADLSDSIQRFKFYQFLFFQQWKELRAHANTRGVKIVGDIPIFVAYDSADAWANPELFFFDADGRPTVVAGVPPDGFSPTGQLWGNPLYNWPKHKETGFAWWLARFRATLAQVDIIRLDHFRGFAGYYEIPATDSTAEHGRWVSALGQDLFAAMQQSLGELPILAEDLGLITDDVVALRDGFGFPGMKIIQFAFSGPDNPFLPHCFNENFVAYTGVHDNDTTRGWYESASEHEREFALRYLGLKATKSMAKEFPAHLIRAAWASVAVFAIAPMQDFLALGGEARFNFPSRLGGNWDWRMDSSALTDELRDRIRELNYLYQR